MIENETLDGELLKRFFVSLFRNIYKGHQLVLDGTDLGMMYHDDGWFELSIINRDDYDKIG